MLRSISVLLFCAVVFGGCQVEDRPPASPGEVDPATALARYVPHDSLIPEGREGASIRRGRALVIQTKDSLPDLVGNQLNCTSCHLEGGLKPDAMPLVGVYARFPQYRGRSATVELMED
ncbi:MAG: c-type cytochrome, partial [Gemmatimonadales bacterium]